MKTIVMGALALLLAGCSGGTPATASPTTVTAGDAQTATVYTCSMHPEILSDKPGKCPKCHMDLVVKK